MCLACELIKCQSFKPYHLLSNSLPVHRMVEQPDPSRSPFRPPMVIDLDRIFSATHSLFPDQLKAARSISGALFVSIQNKMDETIERAALSDTGLRAINLVLLTIGQRPASVETGAGLLCNSIFLIKAKIS